MTDDLMKVKEVMAYLNISRSTLIRLTKDGKLPVVRMGPKTIRYHKADVEKLIEESKG